MKKARALFAAVIIVIVAGASAGAWYLNENGYIGENNEIPSGESSYIAPGDSNGHTYYNTNYNTNNNAPDIDEDKITTNPAGDNEKSSDNDKSDANETTTEKPGSATYDESINEFLSVFSRVYFAENKAYSYENYDNYEVLRFAYSHIFSTDRSRITTKHTDDDIGYYFGVSFDDVNEVLSKYLGITVSRDSVYTENTYAFFKYEDGYFYAPAAEGLAYANYAIADSITEKDGEPNICSVDFTVYTPSVKSSQRGEKCASGTAEIEKTVNGLILKSYTVNK